MSAIGEVEEAFQRIWMVGSVNEDWQRWPDHFTEDVLYVERVFGTLHGRAAVRSWITDLMAVRADVHAVLDWYVIQGDRVVLNMLNRYYHPDPSQPHLDFAGLTVLGYAGDGLFSYEEDYWDTTGAKSAYTAFTQAVETCGGRGLGDGRLEALEKQRRSDTLAVFDRRG